MECTSLWKILLVSFSAVTVMSCGKEAFEGQVCEKTFPAFGAPGADATKVSLIPGGEVHWKAGDRIYWYMCSETGAVSSLNKGREDLTAANSGQSCDIHVTYTAGTDRKVLAYMIGGTSDKVGANYSYSSIKTTLGINTTQNGTYEDNTILKAVTDIEDNVMEFKQIQSFISFSLLSVSGGDGTFTKMKISSKDGRMIAGDVEYFMSTDNRPEIFPASPVTEAWKTITIDSAAVNKKYYVAILPGKYDSGLRISLCDNSGQLVYVDTREGITIGQGEICELGILDGYRTVPGTAIPNIYPKKAWIVNKGGLNMTKKIWIEFEPSDVSSVEWTVSPADKATITPGPDERYAAIGNKMTKTAVVTPNSDYDSGLLTVTATLTDGVSRSCSIEVGDFIDLGLNNASGKAVLWAYSNLTGDAGSTDKGTLRLTDNYDDFGSYYMWGYTVSQDSKITWSATSYNKWIPSGSTFTSWPGTAGTATFVGGKYNSSAKVILDDADDAANVANSDWHIPSRADADSLNSNTVTSDVMNDRLRNVKKYLSNKAGYTDVCLYLIAGGSKSTNGGMYLQNSTGFFHLNEVSQTNMPYSETSVMGPFEGCYFLRTFDVPVSGLELRRFGGTSIRPVKYVSR